MVHARVVPWSDTKELEELKEWFYNDNNRERAVARVRSYQSKGSQHLPHVIDSTAQLTSAILLDESGLSGINAIRLTYTMSLIRFVNGILDPSQQSQFAIPLHLLAKKVGLSSWFVDLRHWGTHERELPGLDMLRVASKEALVWLWDHYWNDNELEESSDEERDENKNTVEDDPEKVLLNRLLLIWPGLMYDFKSNKSVWQTNTVTLISSTNFSVSEDDKKCQITPEDKINNYISQFREIWKPSNNNDYFLEKCMNHYNSLLFHVLILKLNGFGIALFKWLVKAYDAQLDNTDKSQKSNVLGRYFSNWNDLEMKLVKRSLNNMDIKTIISKWAHWKHLLEVHPSYLTIIIYNTILKKLTQLHTNNDDWRKKKKKRQMENNQELIKELQTLSVKLSKSHTSTEKSLYELSFKRKIESKPGNTTSQNDKLESTTNDILGDLVNLKRRMNQTFQSSESKKEKLENQTKRGAKYIKQWKSINDWTPRPFGTL